MSEPEEISYEDYRRRSRRSVLTGGAASLAGLIGWRAVKGSTPDGRIPGVLRDVHEVNESIWSNLFRDNQQAKTFSRSEASILRVNGRKGLEEEIDLDRWQLRVVGPDGARLGTHTLDDIKALPKYEMTIEHKCIEGWAQVTSWSGARFSDFMDLYADELGDDITHVELSTPDRGYYASLEMATLRHDQTLLVYQMLDEPLDSIHGAPLRLATPLKYGIKQVKRIGTIRFLRDWGGDYWGERGYDYYAGL